jgi:glucose-6-phosphate isomerase
MSLKSKNPTNTIAWKKLKTHFEAIKNEHMSDWFKTNSKRAIEMSLQWDDFFLDFSKNRINSETLSLLQDLAEEIDLSDAISKYFNGDKINKTEDRAVLHTALRSPKDAKVL